MTGHVVDRITLKDIDLLDVGNAIALVGALYSGKGNLYLVPFPSTDPEEIEQPRVVLEMTEAEMERFLHQSDVLDIRAPNKAILRKSQRHIDRAMQWRVFERDGYKCRYCGRKAPLTVDHIILWEDGGATVDDNLLAACGPCNRHRGSMEYSLWLDSNQYARVSRTLSLEGHAENRKVLRQLDRLRAIKTKERSR